MKNDPFVKSNSQKGIFEMLLATFIWGSIPIFSIWCNLPSPIFVFFRVLFAVPLVLFYSIRKLGKDEFFRIRPFAPLFLSGIALALNWILFFWAISLTSIANAVVLYYLGPIFTILLAILFLKENFTFNIGLSVFLALGGMCLIFANNSLSFHLNEVLGLIIAFFSGLCFGILGFFSKMAVMHHSAIKLTSYQIIISVVLLVPFLFFIHFKLDGRILGLLLITGIIHTALALFLWYDSFNYLNVITVSIFSYLDPLFAILLGAIFLKQIPTLFQIIGACLIIVAGFLVSALHPKLLFKRKY
ncbi:MAG: DMT family transporter [Desulfurella sp.]|uniref:DMT family transporter n=2 Tax=Desulfurella sp. TaxID=1962857 RepID=UPI003D0A7CA3